MVVCLQHRAHYSEDGVWKGFASRVIARDNNGVIARTELRNLATGDTLCMKKLYADQISILEPTKDFSCVSYLCRVQSRFSMWTFDDRMLTPHSTAQAVCPTESKK